MKNDAKRVAVIGFGAMAQSLKDSLRGSGSGIEIAATLVPHDLTVTHDGVEVFHDIASLLAWGPSVVVECASHEAVRNTVPPLLRAGIDVIVVSIGSLGDADLLLSLETAASAGGSRLTVASGAIGGLDVLRSAKIAGLESVVYTGTKPPSAWNGTPAEQKVDLASLQDATVIFEGNAAEASRQYPKNANVTAAVALAGVGFENTKVTLVADPHARGNTHKVNASGAFGKFEISLENKPLPDNPKTSWLAALSVEQALHRHFQRIEL
ncbi:aspartate dehydrogenase [Shinella sp.]|uniref:aspartate dehydrogenase n=1 Tax=Shinella sp. TaxID=1870904 RepID=UPI0029BE2E6C|nr:aspartate dehydrogenase [Shinella sp.]MDX3976400.1 aspartate dehydrogenase [Shinella sp.]